MLIFLHHCFQWIQIVCRLRLRGGECNVVMASYPGAKAAIGLDYGLRYSTDIFLPTPTIISVTSTARRISGNPFSKRGAVCKTQLLPAAMQGSKRGDFDLQAPSPALLNSPFASPPRLPAPAFESSQPNRTWPFCLRSKHLLYLHRCFFAFSTRHLALAALLPSGTPSGTMKTPYIDPRNFSILVQDTFLLPKLPEENNDAPFVQDLPKLLIFALEKAQMLLSADSKSSTRNWPRIVHNFIDARSNGKISEENLLKLLNEKNPGT